MKYRMTNYYIITWLLTASLILALTGCKDSAEDKKVVAENIAIAKDTTSIKEVKKEVQDLVQALENYTVVQREEAVESTKTALDKLDKEIDSLETKIDNDWDKMNKAAREKSRSNLKALHKQRTEVAEWYGRLENSSADAWEDMKKGFSDSYKNLQDAWNETGK